VADTVDAIPRDARAAVVDGAVTATLGALASTARSLAAAVLAERDADPVGVEWTGAAVRAALASVADVRPAAVLHYGEAAAILDRAAQYAETARVTAAALNAGRAADGPVPRPVSEDVDEPAPVLATVRAILAPDSLILRYALRVAVVVATAVALTDLLDFKRGYWMTITAIVILQPYTGVTTQRAMQRVAGTVLGGIITAALGALFHDPRAILVLAFVLAATCVALLPLNYAAFSIFLTPTFVLLAEASAGDWHLAGVRVAHTLLGGTLALAGSRLLWPSPEWRRLPGYMAAALSANRNYLRSVIELFDDRSVRAGETIRTARRAIGLATVNAEESFQRLVGELDGPVGELSPALTFLTYTRRLTASIAALALARHTAPVGAGEGTTLAPFAHAATRVLDDLAAAVVAERRPAALPILVTTDGGYAERVASPLVRARLDRLARQIRLLHDAIDRWTTRNDDTRPASAQMQR
jgi:uncharacterized membrane protein YccC